MKRLIICVYILLNSCGLFAQKLDSVSLKPGKTRNVEGTLISSSNNILMSISSLSNLSIFNNAIKTANLTDNFSGNGVITVFAPTNKAFEKLGQGKADSLLMPSHQKELSTLLLYHCINGRITSKDIRKKIIDGGGQATLTTISGGILVARINENRNIVLTDEKGNQSVVSKFDITQSNGILNMVTAILTPNAK